LINYPYKLTTRTAEVVSTKIMWNSVINTPSAMFGSANIENMYLEMPLDWYEYMKMPLLPGDIIAHYKLLEKALDGYIYMEIRCGMYRLPQVSILGNKVLNDCLAWHRCFEVPHTSGLWKHISCPIWFNLCVDDFGVKYVGDDHLQNLFTALQTKTYIIVEDWTGDLYCDDINFDWNYAQCWVDISMPVYVIKNLTWYNHTTQPKPQHCLYKPNPIFYGKDNQVPTQTDESPVLDAAAKQRMQQIVSTFLYYAWAVDPTILMALSAIASQ
jgi:hypothetical protein